MLSRNQYDVIIMYVIMYIEQCGKESQETCNGTRGMRGMRRSQQTRADVKLIASATTWSLYLMILAFLLETVTDT